MVRVALAALLAGLLPGAPALPATGDMRTDASRPGEGGTVLVGVEGPLPAPGSRFLGHRVDWTLPELGVVALQAADPEAAAQGLRGRAGVRFAEGEGTVAPLATPDDPRYAGQHGPRLVGAPAAWDRGYGSAGVKVAVVDSGVDRSHPDLAGGRLLQGHDYARRDAVPEDECGHGTAVTGIVGAATGDGVGLAGLAQVSLLPLKVMRRDAAGACTGTAADVAKAIVDATAQGARVVNLSLAIAGADGTIAAALQHARDRGVLVVAGAGNTGGAVLHPAAGPDAVAVGAVDARKAVAAFSSRGPPLDLVAPGTGIDLLQAGGGYRFSSGTSYAAAHVTGALALALSCAPGLDGATLRGHLEASAEDLGPAGRDDAYGHGLVRADRLVARACPTAPVAAAWAPTFAVSGGSNEWWVDVRVTASGVARVEVHDGSAWRDLPRTDWGTWAASFHLPRGTTTTFRATGTAGQVAVSATSPWLGPAAAVEGFSATFTPKGMGNAWWVEVEVKATAPLAGVSARVGSTVVELPKTSWGTWAKSVHAPAGTAVAFTARSEAGTATSQAYTW